MQIFHKDVLEIHKILNDLKQTFPNESITTDILPLKNEGEDINPIPFFIILKLFFLISITLSRIINTFIHISSFFFDY